MSPTNQSARRRFRILCVTIVLVGAGLIWWQLYERRSAAYADRCRANLSRISQALHAYHNQYGMFPPAYFAGPEGQPAHSWRVLLLPFLGEQNLYEQYRFDEPWDGPHNRSLLDKMPDVYACPAATRNRTSTTNYRAVVGRATAWPEKHSARLEDIRDDIAETIHVVESANPTIAWLEPRDVIAWHARYRYGMSSAHGRAREFFVVMVDGTTRLITRDLSRDNFRSLLSIDGGRPLAGVGWPRDAVPEVALPPPRPAEELEKTDVLPHPTGPITSGRNYAYCATFELAWDDARRLGSGGSLRLHGNPPLATALNQHTFRRQNLSAGSYVARAGPGSEAFRDQLRQEIECVSPGFQPRLVDLDGQDHVVQIYAYLHKSLPFSVAFDKLSEALRFDTGEKTLEVASFGAPEPRLDDGRSEQMESQVTILDYVSDDDFVLRLSPAETRDEIILAKIQPAETLEETITSVRRRIAKPDPQHTDKHFLSTEPLAVPVLECCIERHFREITDRQIIGSDLYISRAIQVIQFQLNESGARLESEAIMLGDNGHVPHTPAGKRKFVFSRPFLIYLIEQNADQPYFAAWIANTELMQPFRQ
jgi:hypothetical protein